MTRALVISIRFYDGRFHGASEWPPAPARLFQALIAGAGLGGPLETGDCRALEWLERLDPPLIGAPCKRDGSSVALYVPDNGLDWVGGDPRRIAEIRRDKKVFKPRLFDPTVLFVYAWTFEQNQDSAQNAAIICKLAERLYQFGRGIDFACAWGEELDTEAVDERFLSYSGNVHRPSPRGEGVVLKCPARGSFKSLNARYRATAGRLHWERRGQVFTQTPVARFRPIAYDSPACRYIFELHEGYDQARFAVWPPERITRLIELLRDGSVTRLCSALPSQRAQIERVLVGRKPDGSNDGPASDRVRILPLPSIGHSHADRGIRRVLVEVPSNCPLRADDLQWAFSGLALADPNEPTGPLIIVVASGADGSGMLAHYGIGDHEGHYHWRTVTPAVLPEATARRRINLEHRMKEAKGGRERSGESARAAAAVLQALRHAQITKPARAIRLQREPFEAKGKRAETFAAGTRFSKHRFWHVEIEFGEQVKGPVVIGDGRFLGLGIMAPARHFNLVQQHL